MTVYWGPNDGGTNPLGWAHAEVAGLRGEGPFAVTAGPLVLGEEYVYRAFAKNAYGQTWAPESSAFTLAYSLWSNTMQIAVSELTANDVLEDFPILVRLGTNIAGFAYEQFASPSGADLRFSESLDSEALPFEIEKWDPLGESTVWVKTRTIAPGTNVLWAYWGNPGAAVLPHYALDGSAWKAGFRGVWHFNATVENPATNTHQGVVSGTLPDDGVVAGGRLFDGIDDHIDPEFPAAWYQENGSGLTISLWARPYARDHGTAFGSSRTGRVAPLYIAQESGMWEFAIRDTLTKNREHAVDTNTWQMLTLVMDGGQARAYKNGMPAASAMPGGAFLPTVSPWIGHRNDHAEPEYRYHGALDEVRIAACPRSADWVRASYLTVAANHAVTAYSVGGETPADADGDGLPDDWERRYFGSTDHPMGSSTNDWDGDGLSNLDELTAGTDPTNEFDVFTIAVDLLGGTTRVTLLGLDVGPELPGYERFYRLEKATNLTNGAWPGVPDFLNVPGRDEPIVYSDGGGDDRQGYFRGRVWLEGP